MKISKQAVHAYIDRYFKQKEEKMQLLPLIYSLRMDHPTMGLRDMYYKLQPENMGRDAFEEFCKYHKLMSKQIKNFYRTTDSSGVVRFDNLLHDVVLTDLDQVWQSDISYYEVNGKFYYLTFVLDGFSRRIVGHHTSQRLITEQTTIPALQMGIKTRKDKNLEGLVFHSDGGGQYYDKMFLALSKKYKLKNSMCEFPWENGKAERINGVIKNNYLKHRKINNFSELVKEVDRAVSLYNKEKPHIKLKRKSPITYEKELLSLHKQTRPTMIESFDAKTKRIRGIEPQIL